MNENKTNAPIKLPVRVVNNWLQDCNGKTIADLSDHNTKEVNEHVVAALNEANALRAEVEGLRTAIVSAIRETCDIRQAIRVGKTDNLIVIENSFYVIQDNLEMALRELCDALADHDHSARMYHALIKAKELVDAQ